MIRICKQPKVSLHHPVIPLRTLSAGTRSLARGFTLIEMLVVLGIIMIISSMMLPSVSNYFQLSMSAATRDLAGTIKETYNSAVLRGKVYRIAYDLKQDTYWVESGPLGLLLETSESIEKAKDRKWLLSSKAETPKSPFQMDTSVTRKKIPLPRGVVYEDVITQQHPDPVTDGMVYTHFFPNGMSEQTLIHLKDSTDHHASLAINSILGTTDLYDRYVAKADVFKN